MREQDERGRLARDEETPARCRGFLWLGVWECGDRMIPSPMVVVQAMALEDSFLWPNVLVDSRPGTRGCAS
jgi:hypothetical protein